MDRSIRPSSARFRSRKSVLVLLMRARDALDRPRASLVEAAEVGIDQAPDPQRRSTLKLKAPLLPFLEQFFGILVGAAPFSSAALERCEKEQGIV